MSKKRLKIIGLILLILLAIGLYVGSWHQKVLLSEKGLKESVATMGSVIDYRQEMLKEVVDILMQDASADANLKQLSVYLASVKPSFPYMRALEDVKVQEALTLREQQLTQTVKDLLKYSHSKPFIWKNANYRMKVRQLYYITLQLYNAQRRVNKESEYFNNKITGIVQGSLNKIFFNYRPVIPLGEIVGRDIGESHQYTLMPVARNKPKH